MFGIDKEKTIQFGDDADGQRFSSEKALMSLADANEWTREDLEAIWNGFAGCAPFGDLKLTKKFKNRPYAVGRIWQVIQRLDPGYAGTAPIAKAAKAKRTPVAKAAEPAKGTKVAEVVRLLQRERGATLAELMEDMGWQRHTVRGFISTLGSKHGYKVQSEKHETKGRVYKIAA